MDATAVVRREVGGTVDAARQQAPAERRVGDERDAELAQRGERGLGLRPVEERVLALERAERVHLVGAAHGRRRRLREAEEAHLALLDELRHRPHGVLDRHARVHAMLVVEIDRVDAEPPEARVACLRHVLGLAVDAGRPVGLSEIAELGREDDLVAAPLERPP